MDQLANLIEGIVALGRELEESLHIAFRLIEPLEVDQRGGTTDIPFGVVGIFAYKQVDHVHVFLIGSRTGFEIQIDKTLAYRRGQALADVDLVQGEGFFLRGKCTECEGPKVVDIEDVAFATHRGLHQTEELTIGGEHWTGVEFTVYGLGGGVILHTVVDGRDFRNRGCLKGRILGGICQGINRGTHILDSNHWLNRHILVDLDTEFHKTIGLVGTEDVIHIVFLATCIKHHGLGSTVEHRIIGNGLTCVVDEEGGSRMQEVVLTVVGHH